MRGWIVAGLAVVVSSVGMSALGGARGTDGAHVALSMPDPAPASENRALEQRYLRATADTLAQTGHARELALASLLRQAALAPEVAFESDATNTTWVPTDPHALAWRQRAAALAGDDTIANILLIAGANRPDTIAHDAARRWAEAAPDNSAPLLLDGLPLAQQLQVAAQRPRYDSAYFPVLRWMRDVLAAHPADARLLAVAKHDGAGDRTAPVFAALLAASVFDASRVAPHRQHILSACAPSSSDAARPGDCRDVARQLQAADTLIVQHLGVELAGRLATQPDAQAAAARLWRASQWRTYAMQLATADDSALQFTRLLADPTITSDVALAQRMLADAGLPLEAPADWQAPRR